MFGLLFLDFKIGYLLWFVLGSTDATGRVPHRSPIWGAANYAAAHASVPRLRFFFFFFFYKFAPNWANSARIRSYRPNQIVSADSRNRPKSALNHAGTAEIGFEWGPNSLLLLCFPFCCVSCLWKYIWNEKDNI